MARDRNGSARPKVWRALGLGLITGAADDDPSAIGTYASAGAKLGPSFLWTAPVTFPMMFAVVYLSSKLGQVTGKGLFAVIRDHYPRWLLHAALVGVLIGNTIEAGADIGGMVASIELLVPLPKNLIVVVVTATILALQFWGSYRIIRNVFRWLALTLLAYVGAAIWAKPNVGEIVRGTLVPQIRFDREFLSLLVAVIGTTLSAYLYTWQSNEEVEEKRVNGEIHEGRNHVSRAQLTQTKWDIVFGMLFSNLIMYFIILATGSTLHKAGTTEIRTAADAAQALRPLAGNAAGLLFSLGVIGVGFLAVPVMTTGAAYDLCQAFGWKHGLGLKPCEGKLFYGTIVVVTLVAMGMNFLGIHPIRALVWSGIVQGFSTPPLMLLILLMTNNEAIMGKRVNSTALNVLGWVTFVAIASATIGLVVTWIL
ncbi:divalent metal cation transporter [Pendulispora brunnea]|uniref:Divalent metal cation transporter n=1 Tax=Pendulispora brunnea TaxID=2905690 RepID=A0ABZ2K5G4_9BACT